MTTKKETTFRERWRENYVKSWTKVRERGKFHFLFKSTILSAFLLFIPVSFVEVVFDKETDAHRLIFRAIISLLGGALISMVAWWANEGQFRKINLDKRIRLPESK